LYILLGDNNVPYAKLKSYRYPDLRSFFKKLNYGYSTEKTLAANSVKSYDNILIGLDQVSDLGSLNKENYKNVKQQLLDEAQLIIDREPKFYDKVDKNVDFIEMEFYMQYAKDVESGKRKDELEPEWQWAKDISIVYTWINGTEDALLERKAKYNGGVKKADQRDRCIDELRYSLRSVYKNLPWHKGKIFFVTPGQTPYWLDTSNPRIVIVDQEDILPKYDGNGNEVNPTFNSFAIEWFLDRVPGVSEQFIQLNDEYFFRRPTHPSFFFYGGGEGYKYSEKIKESRNEDTDKNKNKNKNGNRYYKRNLNSNDEVNEEDDDNYYVHGLKIDKDIRELVARELKDSSLKEKRNLFFGKRAEEDGEIAAEEDEVYEEGGDYEEVGQLNDNMVEEDNNEQLDEEKQALELEEEKKALEEEKEALEEEKEALEEEGKQKEALGDEDEEENNEGELLDENMEENNEGMKEAEELNERVEKQDNPLIPVYDTDDNGMYEEGVRGEDTNFEGEHLDDGEEPDNEDEDITKGKITEPIVLKAEEFKFNVDKTRSIVRKEKIQKKHPSVVRYVYPNAAQHYRFTNLYLSDQFLALGFNKARNVNNTPKNKVRWIDKFYGAMATTNACIAEDLGKTTLVNMLEHAPYVWNRDLFEMARQRYEKYVNVTLSHRFRSPFDFVPPYANYHFLRFHASEPGFEEEFDKFHNTVYIHDKDDGSNKKTRSVMKFGYHMVDYSVRVKVLTFGAIFDDPKVNARTFKKIIEHKTLLFFNLNDDYNEPEAGRQFHQFMEFLYPEPSIFEKPE